MRIQKKLDGVGHFYNRPSTENCNSASPQWLSEKICPREFPRVIKKSDDLREFSRANFSDNH